MTVIIIGAVNLQIYIALECKMFNMVLRVIY